MNKSDLATVIDRAIDGAAREFGCPLSKEAVAELANRILRLSPAQQVLAFKNRDLTNALRVVAFLAHKAYELRQSNRAGAWVAADAAVRLSAALEPRRSQRAAIADARAEAWMQKANLLRIEDQLSEADRAWRRVHRYLGCGSCNTLLLANAALLEASLCRALRRYSKAQSLLEGAIKLYDDLQEATPAVRARLTLSTVQLFAGYPVEAARTALTAASQFTGGDPYLGLVIHHNLILCYAEAGAFDSAHRIFRRAQQLYALFETPELAARAVWVLGRIEANQGRWTNALEAFKYVRQEMSQRSLPFDASLAALEEALAHLHLGDTSAVRELVEAMHPIFIAKGVPTEASAALLLFTEAARRDAATVAQLEVLIADLKDRLAPAALRGAQGRFMA